MTPMPRIDYPFLLEQVERDGGVRKWAATVIDLPGCVAVSDTLEGLFDLLTDAIDIWLESAREDGMPVPKPSASSEFSGHLTLRIAPALHRRLAVHAKLSGVSLNSYIMAALAYDVGHRDALMVNYTLPGGLELAAKEDSRLGKGQQEVATPPTGGKGESQRRGRRSGKN